MSHFGDQGDDAVDRIVNADGVLGESVAGDVPSDAAGPVRDTRVPTPYIVNGRTTTDFPEVGIVNDDCTGTLIAPRFVLTAAHCVENVGNRFASFEVGGETYLSRRIVRHPQYDPGDFGDGYDLAIIELREPVVGVEPTQLLRVPPEVGETLTLVGYGAGGFSGQTPATDFGTKRIGTTPLDRLTARAIEWTVDSIQEANTSPGDSGGPVFVMRGGEPVLAAVVSGGFDDSHDIGGESFNTRVDVFASFIDGVAGTAPKADDVLGYNPLSGDYWAGRSTGESFVNQRIGRFSPTVDWGPSLVADIAGDDQADVVRFDQDSGVWWVGISNGRVLEPESWARWTGAVRWLDQLVGDFDGNGETDVAARNAANGAWYVGANQSDRFGSGLWGRWSGGLDWTQVQAIDVNGDGLDDLLTREAASGAWWAAISDGQSFTNTRLGAWSASVDWLDIQAGDVDGDGQLELLGRNAANGDWYRSDLVGGSLEHTRLGRTPSTVRLQNVTLANVTGDADLELVGYDIVTGEVRVSTFDLAAGSLETTVWGSVGSGQSLAVFVGDFDGDDETDEIAFFQTDTGGWRVADPADSDDDELTDRFEVTQWTVWSADPWQIGVGDVVA